MSLFLDEFLPRILPGKEFLCVPREGKGDLEKSIPRKLRAWREPGARFVVVRDNDGGNCTALKRRLRRLCDGSGRGETQIRIVCQELEAWYLGDFASPSAACDRPALLKAGRRARFRNPDAVASPSAVLEELIPAFQKASGARRMGRILDPGSNRSASLRSFVEGVRSLAGQSS